MDRHLANQSGVGPEYTKRVDINCNQIRTEQKMNARTNEATAYEFTTTEETSEAVNLAQYAMLNELPGVIFGFMTLAWIVTSLLGLV